MDEPGVNPFPTDGWRFDGSRSYGTADLYRDIPHVVVNASPERAKAAANEAYGFLRDKGAATATIEEIVHVDGELHFYVFAERDEFLAIRERWFPDVVIAPLRDRKGGSASRSPLERLFRYLAIAIVAHGVLFALYALAIAPRLGESPPQPVGSFGFFFLYAPASVLAIPLNPMLWRFGLMETPGWFAWPKPLGFAVVYCVWFAGFLILSRVAAHVRRGGAPT